MARKKNRSMRWQVEEVLLAKLCIGQSKHEAKEREKERIKDEHLVNGQEKKNKIKLDGIYSWSTYNSYKKHSIAFAEWTKKKFGCKTLESAKFHVQDYLNYRMSLNLSAWTIKLDANAITKLYGVEVEELGIHTPDRRRKDIKRSRFDWKHDKHISKEKNEDLIGFCKGTGLRRHELAAITPEDIKFEEGNLIVHVKRGKGGKARDVQVLEEFYPYVEKYIRGLPYDEPIFKKIPKNLDVHSYRAEFACAWYEKLARSLDSLTRKQKYYCKGDMKGIAYDRRAMIMVSKALGHERINVIVSNYLWKRD